jgi:hypothetical protein
VLLFWFFSSSNNNFIDVVLPVAVLPSIRVFEGLDPFIAGFMHLLSDFI